MKSREEEQWDGKGMEKGRVMRVWISGSFYGVALFFLPGVRSKTA